MYKYLIDGGIFMWFILLSSIFALAIIIDRILAIYHFHKNYDKKILLEKINNSNLRDLLNYCSQHKDCVSKFIKNTFQHFSDEELNKSDFLLKNNEKLREIMEEYINQEINILEKGMWLLSSIVNAAPQLGLLGTVTGMITSFAALMNNNAESASVVAGGISEALYTTAFGLIVSIPSLVCYNFLNKKINDIINEMYAVQTFILTQNITVS